MRDLILTMAMSLDGFVCGPNGELDWIFNGDQEAIAWKVETVSSAGLHIMGSRTFKSMAGFWPTAAGPFAAPMNEIAKAVFSQQGTSILEAAKTGNWRDAYVASGDLREEIARLKAIDGKPIVAHGGAAFARSLIAGDLVDEYRLMVYPIALGSGLPIFSGVTALRRLELVSSKTFPKGTQAQVYRRA
ncbi:dihydrofolate reductase family protein [Rhizobium sp. Rhizsp82]|uniref:dihydrofolate reductase family protein n=1 Tax=Rhizobium sp. Rhizsp82 TaxID=3243057 RepID=UPI0039B57B5F